MAAEVRAKRLVATRWPRGALEHSKRLCSYDYFYLFDIRIRKRV